ncbi:MAG: hypothetical protein RLY31_2353 [Bacteroidota bacterium]|jgi:nicotinamide-nucleotide amidase
MKVHILTIGDELLIGQIIDTNGAKMAQLLLGIGATVTGKSSVGDDHDRIVAALAHAAAEADIVLVTGGLGPTKDDVTKKALAHHFGTGLVLHQPTLDHITRIWQRLGRPIDEDVRNQALLPENAVVLPNKLGTAPGMWFDTGDYVLVSMPGVPFEMEHLMENEVLPRLSSRFMALPTAHRTLLTAGEGESVLAGWLRDFEAGLPDHVKLAYLPSIGRVRLRLLVSHPDGDQVRQTLDQYFSRLQQYLPPAVIAGYDEDTLETVVGKLLRERLWTLSTAESCTGGFLAHLITAVPGASAYFTGSTIAYDNSVKTEQLGVSTDTLNLCGAVSEETVRQMVAGSLRHLHTDVAVATSGIAGPGGGTTEKPVGTIWVAVGTKDRTVAVKLQLGRDRLRNIQQTGYRALDLLRRFLLGDV